jgi:hypothetical protein
MKYSCSSSLKSSKNINVGSNYISPSTTPLYYQPNEISYNTNLLNTNINLEKTSLELSLNIVGIEHIVFDRMSKHEFLGYYDNFIKNNSNINKILAINILLKNKIDNSDDTFNYNKYNLNSDSLSKNNSNKEIQNNSFNSFNPNNFTLQQYNKTSLNSNLNNILNQNTVFNKDEEIKEHKPTYNLQSIIGENSKNNNINNSEQYNKPNLQTNKIINADISPDFDLNSIIDKYTNIKNSGQRKNIDISYNQGNLNNTNIQKNIDISFIK